MRKASLLDRQLRQVNRLEECPASRTEPESGMMWDTTLEAVRETDTETDPTSINSPSCGVSSNNNNTPSSLRLQLVDLQLQEHMSLHFDVHRKMNNYTITRALHTALKNMSNLQCGRDFSDRLVLISQQEAGCSRGNLQARDFARAYATVFQSGHPKNSRRLRCLTY
jgi:hypothetical protein